MQSRKQAETSRRGNSHNRPWRGLGNTPRGTHSPGCRCNGLGKGSAELHEFLESGAEGTTTQKRRQGIMSRIMTEVYPLQPAPAQGPLPVSLRKKFLTRSKMPGCDSAGRSSDGVGAGGET